MIGPAIHHFACGPNAVREALRAARAFCAMVPAVDADAVALIVEELVANLVDHALVPDASIDLTLRRDATHVRLTLSDDGAPFDPRAAPPPGAAPPARGGGAGLALVRAFSRIELYTRVEGRNHLHLAIPLREG